MGSLPIQIVDENDQPVGSATKQEAWDKGLIHRCVRVVVENAAGQILLQHRTLTKDIFPNCWDTAAAGHVDAGEDYDAAVVHEIDEELGLKGLALTEMGTYRSDETIDGRRFNRFARVYRATSEETPTQFEVGKIDGWRWFTIQDIKELIKNHPDQVTDGLRQVFERYY